MKAAHWVQVLITAILVGLESASTQTTGNTSMVLHLVSVVLVPTLAALGIISPSASAGVNATAVYSQAAEKDSSK